MNVYGWAQIFLYFLVILALTRPMGNYLYRVFEGERKPFPGIFGAAEYFVYRALMVDKNKEQTWKEYAFSLFIFSFFGILALYALQRLQFFLPFNPQTLEGVTPELAFNTAVSFVTNTNWQAYPGESTMGYLVQMAGLAWQNFLSAGAGIAVAFALARGLTRKANQAKTATIGNFWVDITRCTIYVLLPLSLLGALFLVSQGVIQNINPYREIVTLEGTRQSVAMGPVASQEIIKELGTNGGGFFNANSSHPFENPTPLTNFIEMVLIFLIPAGLTYTYGRMSGNRRQGWVLFCAMAILFMTGTAACYQAESHPNPILAGLPLDHSQGNMEGKEVRFGTSGSALFTVITTAASCGAVNSMHDSYTPMGGLVPLVNIMLGEVVFGGTGAGLYGMLIYAILAVFIAGLMVGRTPEYLGKKIEIREMQYAMAYILIFPVIVLITAAWSAAAPYGAGSVSNGGPHGLSQILYAASSAGGNNGSAFAGLNANTPWWNIMLGIAMLAGRFLMIVPVLAIGGSMAAKKDIPPGPGTFPTDGFLFVILLTGAVIIIGALTFFPALSIGPIVEHFMAQAGRRF
ncbi:MAG TPA: potassium-transporting ATPase subunit KdpA [Syntrophorhabdaceae bacterium]|nr:potassium-transporting ATPase subunit KdpA [Syntrophorhabdaceae bacterium]